MELRVLRYFLAIAREGTISAAADYLHMSQPTLSRQIRELEEELGTQLIIRGNRSITLTEAGLLLRRRAEEVISLIDKTEAEITRPDEIISGDVYIGCGETYAMHIIAQIADAVRRDYPDIKYHLYSANGNDVRERLDKGLLDFGILVDPSHTDTYHTLRLPMDDTWGVLMRKDSALAAKDFVEPSDLTDLPILCSSQELVQDNLSRWLGKNLNELNIAATYNLIYNASILVEDGFGYALTLDRLINTTGDSALCFRPLRPELRSQITIIWKKYQVFSRAAQVFLNRVTEVLR